VDADERPGQPVVLGHRPSPVAPGLRREGAEQAPYNVIVVRLDEDPALRMVGNLDGDPAEVGINSPVRVVFPEPIEDVVFPRWVPA
jgi:uncharacterized OB-fold protein